ncbi:MAG: hypothetical protein WDN28_17780 [Chthoniobacter sp.]
MDVLNALNEQSSDIDYYYTSRLRGEPAEGVNDIHTHPNEPPRGAADGEREVLAAQLRLGGLR